MGIMLGLVVLSAGTTTGRSAARTTQPNIVLILTDDQRADTLWAMPKLKADLIDRGVLFKQGFVVNTLCCPSRTSILTSQWSHTTGVYGNGGDHGGFNSFHGDSSTIATWLHDAGYHTGLIGKYLNGYNVTYIPPGWDRWLSFDPAGASGGAYYDYKLIDETGTYTSYGSNAEDYSTDVLSNAADSFIRTANPDQPLFLMFTPFAPHVPSTPAPEYVNRFRHLAPYRPPNFNEADVSDKPAWVQALPLLNDQQIHAIDNQRKDRYRTLLSVDDAVDQIVTALSDTGRLSNTMIVFMSDNGSTHGEHRWKNKKVAWEESLRVPMVIRYDPLISRARSDNQHFVLNVDVAPTFAEIAGVSAPGAEGASLVPLLVPPGPPTWRTDFLIEHLKENVRDEVPTYCAVRNQGYTYVYYQDTQEEELYDLTIDPYELDNKVNDPSYGQVLNDLRAREAELCQPPPPPP